MNRKILFLTLALFVAFSGVLVAADLEIDYQVNVSKRDSNNYFTFKGPIRYIAADKDQFDTKTGASMKNSTEIFQPYRYDVLGKNVFPDGLRSFFLFAVADYDSLKADTVTVSESGGVITINYVHRGTAYQIQTDSKGALSFPDGKFLKRSVGYIVGGGPQVISKDFSSNGKADKIDWAKVWDASIPGGKIVDSGNAAKTGNIIADVASAEAMFHWAGTLQVSYSRNLVKISGGLNAVKR